MLSSGACRRPARRNRRTTDARDLRESRISSALSLWSSRETGFVCDSLDLDLREQVLGEVKSAKIEVSTSMVKTDLKANVDVPGCKLAGGTYLVRK
jgi:hypothetical protein